MEIGKLPNELLQKMIIEPIQKSDVFKSDVIVGPQVGEDCGAVRFGKEIMVISSDPVTGAEDNLGKLLVNICANDVASSGASLVALSVTALFPPDITKEEIIRIMEEINEAASTIGIQIIGGHTEVTDAVRKPVLSGTAIGKIKENQRFIYSKGARLGDDIIMTKWAGLEGSSILAGEFEQELSSKLPPDDVLSAKAFDKYLSIVPEAMVAAAFEGVGTMHDITEGGVFGACYEMADEGKGFQVYLNKIPVKEETRQICAYFNINPYKLISSGSLLITASNGGKLVEELEKAGIHATNIGVVTNGPTGYFDEGGKFTPIEAPQPDDLYKAKASKKQVNIMFVCTGNTCRSPMAEALAHKRAAEKHINACFYSRGMSAYGNGPASGNAIAVMQNMGADLSAHRSQPVTQQDVDNADVILAMSESHKMYLIHHFKGAASKTYTLAEFTAGEENDILDPYGGSMAVYEKCAEEIDSYITMLMDKIAGGFL